MTISELILELQGLNRPDALIVLIAADLGQGGNCTFELNKSDCVRLVLTEGESNGFAELYSREYLC